LPAINQMHTFRGPAQAFCLTSMGKIREAAQKTTYGSPASKVVITYFLPS
jgi:hypothetical protein